MGRAKKTGMPSKNIPKGKEAQSKKPVKHEGMMKKMRGKKCG